MQSSIAISSATRVGGSYSATAFPITQIAPCPVPRARIEAIRLGDGIMPYPLAWCSLTHTPSKPSRAASSNSSRYSL